MRRRKVLLLLLMSGLLLSLLSMFVCNRLIERGARGKLYWDTKEVPYHKAGLLLGTGKYLSNGKENPYYTYRIEAAVQLLKANRIRYVVISGDNSRKDYNEPELMRDDLLRAGIEPGRIFLDYAGFRTFDSIVRLKEIFGQQSVTLISQPFHNERALYIAAREGISAVGFNARDVPGKAGLKVQAREGLARVKVFLDFLTGIEPKFGGPRIHLPD